MHIGGCCRPTIPAKAAGPVAGSRGHDLCGTIHSANAIFTGVYDKKIPHAVDCDARWGNEHRGRSWPVVPDGAARATSTSCNRGDRLRAGVYTANPVVEGIRDKEVSCTVDCDTGGMIELGGSGRAPVSAVTAKVRVVGVCVTVSCNGSDSPRGGVHAINQVAGVVREKEISRTVNRHTASA